MSSPEHRRPGLAMQGNTALLALLGLLLLLAVMPYPVPSDQHAGAVGQPVPAPPELAALLAEHARLLQLGYSAAQFRNAYSRQAWLGAPAQLQQRPAAPYPVRAFAQRVGAQFAHTATHGLLPCVWDASLPLPMEQPAAAAAADAQSETAAGTATQESADADEPAQLASQPAAPSSKATRYFLASNQYNSAHAMPNFVLQLLSLALLLPNGSLYISIYESGSSDSTPEWLQFLRLLLESVDVPASITVRGSLTRQPGQDRLAFLATVRNAALAPLAAMAAAAAAAPSGEPHGKQPAASVAAAGLDSSSSGGSGSFLPDHVIFINDVYFCAGDVVRLMQHGADMACGLDASRTLGGSPWASRLLALPLEFYDYWVARDVDGRRLRRYAPYAVARASVARMRAGLPFGVYCCWNGLVVLRAAPFVADLRFRRREASAGECDASECSLMCDDFHRLGYEDAVIDPGVRVAYDWGMARALAGDLVELSRSVPWSKVVAAPHYRTLLQQQREQQVGGGGSRLIECCPKIPGGEHADFSKCAMVDVFAVNHTHTVLNAASSNRAGNDGL